MGISSITRNGHPVKKITLNGGVWWQKSEDATYSTIMPSDTNTHEDPDTLMGGIPFYLVNGDSNESNKSPQEI